MITKSTADRIKNTTLGGAGGSMTSESEVQRIVELAVLKLDLKYTEALNGLRNEITKSIDSKLLSCQQAGEKKRRWKFSAIFTVVMALIAFGSAVAANWP